MRKRTGNQVPTGRGSSHLSSVPLGKSLEKDVKRRIIQFLRIHGVFCWVNVSTGIWDVTRERFRKLTGTGMTRGVSDVLGIYKGRFLAIEVKAPGKKNTVTIYQKQFLESVNHYGGIAFLAESVEDVESHLGLGRKE